MECSNCNYKIQLDNKFCGNCGTQIKNSLDIEQSSENINIPKSDNVPFSFKKWFDNKYPLAPQEFEILYDKNQIDLYEISQIREFWVSVDPNTKMETIKIWENNLKLKNNAVKIDIKNSLDIEQSSENINIPKSDNVPFSFKKWFDNKYPLAPQEFEILYDKNQIDLYEISQIREFWVSVDPNTKMETIKIWENNLKLKNNAVKIDIKNSLDIEQSSENINIPKSDNVPFSFKKLSVILIGVLARWILIIIIIPSLSFILNFLVFGKLTGGIIVFGGVISLNLIIFGFANRNIASNSNRNVINAFWLGLLGPLGLVICLFNSVKLLQKKILLGVLRFLFFAIAMQLLGELGIISNAVKGLIIYFFGFTFILRGVNMFNYSVKKMDIKI